MSENQTTEKATTRTFVEEFEIAGNKVVDKVKEMVAQGNVRRLIVKTQDGRTLVDTSLTVGVGVGGFLGMIGGFPLAIFATLAMIVTKVKVEVVREVTEGDILDSKQKVEINVDEE